ncbi:hypothetical protein [Ralstonia mannitolilytica]|uniref:KfrB domain-containing protein n=1 Tax=Ralstonia mannitolilytica TaxID=105219 RepID=UPI00374A8C12
MERWTEDEFRRIALDTRISERTLEACKDVLVGGMLGVDAANKHRMFPSQISRAITTLRDKKAEEMEISSVSKEADEMRQYVASEVARALQGKDFQCVLAQPGQLYEGPIIVQSKGYLVQKVGRTGVLHDLARFTTIPPLNENLQIAYALDGGMARVGAAPAPEKSKGPER